MTVPANVHASTQAQSNLTTNDRAAWFAVLVAALGYFVDVFDMWLFSNYRVASLKDLGLSPEQITLRGAELLNYQQAGFLIGGFFWGMMGDKRGRTSVMFGSIILYSIGTFLNAFAQDVTQYAICRFISGLGLAGEIGAGITLVSELLPANKRGWGTTLVTMLGVSGAIGAAAVAKFLHWQTAYIIGGVLGFALLLLRVLVHESGIFGKLKRNTEIKRGSLKVLFGTWSRAFRYLCCVAIGIPIYLIFGIFAAFSPEIAKALGILEPVSVPDVMIYASIGVTLGDLLAGTLSQLVKSRRLPMQICMVCGLATLLTLLRSGITTPSEYAHLLGIAGLFSGYWACLITTASEQFGTNIRATATTSIPNVIRGSAILLISGFATLKLMGYDVATAALVLTGITYTVSILGLLFLKESYGKELDFNE